MPVCHSEEITFDVTPTSCLLHANLLDGNVLPLTTIFYSLCCSFCNLFAILLTISCICFMYMVLTFPSPHHHEVKNVRWMLVMITWFNNMIGCSNVDICVNECHDDITDMAPRFFTLCCLSMLHPVDSILYFTRMFLDLR